MLFLESIPKMLGLKILRLATSEHTDQGFIDMVGRCIGLHQGDIEELNISLNVEHVNSLIGGLVTALRRLEAIRFVGDHAGTLTPQQIAELSEGAADCETLEELFCFCQSEPDGDVISTDDFKAIFHLCSRFPSLKRVSESEDGLHLHEEGRFTAFLKMVKTSKTIEQVPSYCNSNAEEAAAVEHHCRNNMMHNRIKPIR
jgi:hypothetical protein